MNEAILSGPKALLFLLSLILFVTTDLWDNYSALMTYFFQSAERAAFLFIWKGRVRAVLLI